MGSTRLGSLVWPGMVLAGLLLAVGVWAAWPEPSTRLVRLPYGESQPKSPVAERPARQAAVTPSVERPQAPAASAQADEPARVLAVADSAPATEVVDPDDGPAPVPSETELEEGYVQESPEELGARPLPGVDATPAPPLAG